MADANVALLLPLTCDTAQVVTVGYVCNRRLLIPIGISYMMTHQRHSGALWIGVELFGLVCYPKRYL